MSTVDAVDFEWGLVGSWARAAGRCRGCERVAVHKVSTRSLWGFTGDVARDPQARAVLTRGVLAALRADGCSHAMHDRAALADCIMRPDRARLAGVLGALLDAPEESIGRVLAARSARAEWGDDRLLLGWRAEEVPAVERESWVTVKDGRAKASVTIAVDEAWEMLASRGFVPVEWLGDESRGFRAMLEQGIARAELPAYVSPWRTRPASSSRRARGSDPLSSAPSTLRACVALAADCEGAVAAETLVREVLTRLAPWGLGSVPRISWRVVDAARWRTERQSYWTDSLRATFKSVLEAMPFSLPSGYGPSDPSPRPSWWSLAAAESALAKLWDELASSGIARPDGVDSARLRDFRVLESPYEPLLAIWATGFVLDELRSDEAVLVAPEW